MGAKYITDCEFEKLLEQYQYSFQKGDLVKGTVYGSDGEGVIVDIGAKTNAICPEREARLNPEDNICDILQKGNDYEFLIIREEDDEGRLTVSYKKVAVAYSWKQLETAKNEDRVVTGKVVQAVKGGILVDVLGVRGFVPSSHLRSKDVENIVGQDIELKILTMDVSQNNFILSNRKVYADSIEEVKKDIFGQLEVGQVVKGEIVRIADFGAFVDIGGVDGLLPLSQISWRWVDHPSDILKVSQKVNVEIIGICTDKQRVSLSLKNLEADPWIEAKGKINEGQKVKGKITRIKHFGAFVEVYPSVEALLPQSELLQYQNEHGTILDVGDVINTTILKFNPEDKRISLSVASD
ncbi:30S ribosomal protein S1 [Candidatus Gastranaerophilus sp. (ex Termes propinquus)]|nr:30S ribosomal protein S1 [Candidatus Gastranaerophilus sp. (ex Termes propinquus)]